MIGVRMTAMSIGDEINESGSGDNKERRTSRGMQ